MSFPNDHQPIHRPTNDFSLKPSRDESSIFSLAAPADVVDDAGKIEEGGSVGRILALGATFFLSAALNEAGSGSR